jgi:tRNA (guanine37-N1)-methyltransferase
MLTIDIITIFPKMFEPVLGESIVARAQKKGLVKINIVDLRDYTEDKHKSVDDRPFGGGAGMVMKIEPIYKALSKINRSKKAKVILLSPQGKTFSQPKAKKLAVQKNIILICGHYEGFDERIREHLIDEEISIGDYVLTGGELPAMIVTDTIVRLLPGVLEKENATSEESFSLSYEDQILLEYPQYTRPADFKGWKVPEILLSGDPKKIKAWQLNKAKTKTKLNRPDLLHNER